MFVGNEKAWMGLVAALVGVFVGGGLIDAEQGASIQNLAAGAVPALIGFVVVWFKRNS